MKRVVWSQHALAEFDALVAYIARDNPTAALSVADRIGEAVDHLSRMPTGRRGRVAGTYEKVVSGLPYIIAYALERSAAGDEVLAVLRIVHGARHWPEGGWPDE